MLLMFLWKYLLAKPPSHELEPRLSRDPIANAQVAEPAPSINTPQALVQIKMRLQRFLNGCSHFWSESLWFSPPHWLHVSATRSNVELTPQGFYCLDAPSGGVYSSGGLATSAGISNSTASATGSNASPGSNTGASPPALPAGNWASAAGG